jgi:hypothetical protein
MGFMDKVKAQAEQAAAKAKDTAEDVQTKRDLGKAYDELGKETFRLIEAGEVTNVNLAAHAEKIRELQAKLEEDGGGGVSSTEAEPAAAATESSGPPAMPS